MKKVLSVLAMVALTFSMNAQCNIQSSSSMSGETTERIYVGTVSQGVSFHKVTEKTGESVTYMSLDTRSTYLTSPSNEVKLYFEDESSLKLSNKVSYDSGTGSYWNYSSFIRLTPSLKDKLLKTPLIGFELYIFEQSVDGVKVISALNCVQ